MSKVKKFWEDHKKEIIGATVLTVGGVACYVLFRNHKELKYYKKIFKNLNDFDNGLLACIDEMQKGCNNICSMIPTKDVVVSNAGIGFQKSLSYYAEMTGGRVTADTPVEGVLVFLK